MQGNKQLVDVIAEALTCNLQEVVSDFMDHLCKKKKVLFVSVQEFKDGTATIVQVNPGQMEGHLDDWLSMYTSEGGLKKILYNDSPDTGL